MSSTLSIYLSYSIGSSSGLGSIGQRNKLMNSQSIYLKSIAYPPVFKVCQTPADTKGNRF